MKKWYENISENDFEKYITGKSSENPSEKTDYTFLSRIRNGAYKKTDTYSHFHFIFRTIPAIISVSLLFFIVTFIYQKISLVNNPVSISSINNQVYYVRENNTRLISSTTSIKKDDIIFTGKISECSLDLNERGIITINNETEIRIDSIETKTGHYKVAVEKGTATFQIHKKNNIPFYVNTPLLIIEVIGTQFEVNHKAPSLSTVTLTEGVLSITHKISRDIIRIHAGEVIKADLNGFITDSMIKIAEIPKTNIQNSPISEKSPFRKIIKNGSNEKNNAILGFIPYQNTIIAQSESHITMLDTNGSTIWKKIYGNTTGIRFMSLPVIFNNSLFISSTDKKFITLNMKNGNETSQIIMDGAILFGNTISVIESDVYLPLNKGIYLFNFQKKTVESKPFITITEPLSPIVSDNNFIITSIADKTIGLFSRDGKPQWKYQLSDRSVFKAILHENTIITTDLQGNMYKLDMSGKILIKTRMPFIITSQPVIENGVIYTTDENGTFYSIHPKDFSVIHSILIANNKRNAINQGVFTLLPESIAITDSLATIYIINKKDLSITKKLNTTLVSPVTKIHYFDNKLFAGSRNGDIEIMGIE
ncbi:MAG TPA: hypothetical protein DDY71_07755 [Spirochaetia bacterium]|nr:hypothetical protein [Spirochaetia bacterium]